jgi:hypothetical protein
MVAPVQQPPAQRGQGSGDQADQPGMIQRPAVEVLGPAAAGPGACGPVAGGAVAGGGAGVVVGAGAARTTRVADTPRFPPPQRPVMS